MKEFFKMTLAAMLGVFVVGIIMFLFCLMLLGSLASVGKSEPVMPRSAVLKIDMGTFILAEQNAQADPLAALQNDNLPPIGIWNAITAVNAAATDPDVKMIYLKPDMASGGLAEIEEFRQALINFRSSGKAVVSYMENPSNAGYYLASVSDKIYMTSYDGGMTMITGMSSQLIFLKDILDKLGINVQLIRHGKYKSAGDMLIINEISKENREQNQEMVCYIWG